MEQQVVKMVRDGAIAAGLSFLLLKMPTTAAVFTIPLLFAAQRLRMPKFALLPVLAVLLLIIGDNLIFSRDLFNEPVLRGVMILGLYIPVSLLAGAAIWIGLTEHRMLIRFLAGLIFATICGFALVLWFRGGSETAVAAGEYIRSTYVEVLAVVLGSAFPAGIDGNVLFDVVVIIVESAFLPLFMVQYGVSVLASELLIHRKSVDYQHRMCHWRLPSNAVWVFLGSWTLVLVTLFIKVPVLATVAWNSALAISLLYLVQGISIAAFFVRKRNVNASAFRIFILLGLMVLVPGVNMVPMIVLPLLGVSETWIRFRVNE
ncbi:MAG: YybS family protein [Sphaerochaetaceae bacterium]|nr:YybS family protein [Sphaerochaetaceae bacterium]